METGSDQKRAANEAAFREANERIRAAEQALDPPVEHVPYLCECDDVRCHEPIRLTAGEYERVRADGATFLVARGHPTQGDVVADKGHYSVVRKKDGAGEMARALDPRGDAA